MLAVPRGLRNFCSTSVFLSETVPAFLEISRLILTHLGCIFPPLFLVEMFYPPAAELPQNLSVFALSFLAVCTRLSNCTCFQPPLEVSTVHWP